jgi:excisionase family DNA binding protein
VDEAGRVERNNRDVRQGFYTVSEAAKVLGVGQRRILEMLETKEIEGERDPTSSRWKISKHAVDALAPEESPDTKQPLLTEKPPVTEQDTVELRVAEETQSTEESPDTGEPLLASQPPQEDPTERFSEQSTEQIRERIGELEDLNNRLQLEQQTEKAAWQEERESLLSAADRERQYAEELQEEVERLHTELGTLRERIGELEDLNNHLQLEQQAEKAAWKKERGSLLSAANRELQHTEELQKEVARLSTELGTLRERIGELEDLNNHLQLEQQAEKAAWKRERGSLLNAADRERQHAEELQEEVERLHTELETERSMGFVRRLFGG